MTEEKPFRHMGLAFRHLALYPLDPEKVVVLSLRVGDCELLAQPAPATMLVPVAEAFASARQTLERLGEEPSSHHAGRHPLQAKSRDASVVFHAKRWLDAYLVPAALNPGTHWLLLPGRFRIAVFDGASINVALQYQESVPEPLIPVHHYDRLVAEER